MNELLLCNFLSVHVGTTKCSARLIEVPSINVVLQCSFHQSRFLRLIHDQVIEMDRSNGELQRECHDLKLILKAAERNLLNEERARKRIHKRWRSNRTEHRAPCRARDGDTA